MWKVSFGRRTVYNLAWKQRCPSDLYGDGMALLFQTLVLMDFLLWNKIFLFLLIFLSLLFHLLVITEIALNQSSHFTCSSGASACLTGHTDNVFVVLQEWLSLGLVKDLETIQKEIVFKYFVQYYKSTVWNLMLRKKNIYSEN